MNDAARAAAKQLCVVIEQENALLAQQEYGRVSALLPGKQAALAALDASAALPAEADTDDDKALALALATLADTNKAALGCALLVQDRIMGIMADAARRMMETPLYGGHGQKRMATTSLAVAMIKQA